VFKPRSTFFLSVGLQISVATRIELDANLAVAYRGASKLACILLYSGVWPFQTERRGLKGRKSLKKTNKDERKGPQ
jgi:hypothetical protein